MNIFAWFILGHLLGDWLLQSDWMALGKRQGLFTRAGLAHYIVYTLSILIVLYISNDIPLTLPTLLLISLIVFISHWLIDATNLVEVWMAAAGQRNQIMVRVMVDQTFHLLVLALLAQIFFADMH
jgi:hypothetical protein